MNQLNQGCNKAVFAVILAIGFFSSKFEIKFCEKKWNFFFWKFFGKLLLILHFVSTFHPKFLEKIQLVPTVNYFFFSTWNTTISICCTKEFKSPSSETKGKYPQSLKDKKKNSKNRKKFFDENLHHKSDHTQWPQINRFSVLTIKYLRC